MAAPLALRLHQQLALRGRHGGGVKGVAGRPEGGGGGGRVSDASPLLAPLVLVLALVSLACSRKPRPAVVWREPPQQCGLDE